MILPVTDPEASSRQGGGCAPGVLSSEYHEPVLLERVLEFLEPEPGKLIVDGTLGGGGHTKALLEAGATVIGLDRDPAALRYAGERLAPFGSRFRSVAANYADVEFALKRIGVVDIDGALLDLGVSSWQLDEPSRGFSFQRTGPLDMRMDPRSGVPASDIVNNASTKQLARIFKVFGEEPAANRIARAIEKARLIHEIQTTMELADIVESVVPRRGRIHPATRVFQALRMAVNRELEALEEGLSAFARCLQPGGRFAVISFHSLEDRIVKNFFRDKSAESVDRPEWPAPRPNPDRLFRRVTRKALAPSGEESKRNPRSRSAKLRVVERV